MLNILPNICLFENVNESRGRFAQGGVIALSVENKHTSAKQMQICCCLPN